jgi:hypothetical protein
VRSPPAPALAAAARAPRLPAQCSGALAGGAALTVLYLASAELVTPFAPAVGQTLVSVLWALVGVGALAGGLIGDRPPLRRAGLGLFALTAGKNHLRVEHARGLLARFYALWLIGVVQDLACVLRVVRADHDVVRSKDA